jgi:ketosteroid isomerase-like protein
MEEHSNVRAARTAIEALVNGDTATLAAGIAEGAVWHVPGSNRLSGDLEGRERILDRGREMTELGIQTSVDELHDVLGNDEHVVALLTTTTTGPGGSSSQHVCWVMHAKDGLATELWAHNWDQVAIDRVIGD